MIIKIAAIGLIAAIVAIVVRKEKPEYAAFVAMATGLVVLALLMGDIRDILAAVTDLAQKAGISSTYVWLLLKITGIAYVTQFAASIARDAGENSIAEKIELGGKVVIFITIAPVLFTLLETITGLLP